MKKTDWLRFAMFACLVGAVGGIAWPDGGVLPLVAALALGIIGWALAATLTHPQNLHDGGGK